MFKSLFAALGSLIGTPCTIFNEPTRTPRRPTGAALRNPADPTQAARIEDAAVKRARRADKLQRDTACSARNNDAWFTNGAMPVRLNPIHS